MRQFSSRRKAASAAGRGFRGIFAATVLHNYSAAGQPGGVTEDRESLQPCELQEYVDSGDYSRIFVWYTFKFTLA